MKKLIFALILIASGLSLSAQTQFYVSPTGNDKNSGSIKSPFRTITKAQEAARTANGDVTIYLREGVYRLSEPIFFTPDDSNKDKSLTLKSFPGEHATITGNQPLTLKWESYQGEIVKAKVAKEVKRVDMLLADGEIRHQARYPNYDSTAVRFNGTAADAIAPERVKRWKNPAGGYLHAMHISDWGDFHYRITGKDDTGNLSLEGGWQNNRQSGLHEQNRMVENIFEELDAPGEWYFDNSANVVYYYPADNEDVANIAFETPQLKHLIEFRGDANNKVRNIKIQGIEFSGTERTFMEKYEPLLRSDWTIYRGGAILFDNTEDCSLTDCHLHNLGGNAVFISNYNCNTTISGCHITEIGASAICVVGDTDAVRSPSFEYNQSVPLEEIDRTPGPKTDNYPTNCLIYDNLIHRIGLYEKQVTGVELSMCQYITVSHNSIYDTPRAGINISEGTWGGHIIEYNDVFDTVKETGDHGVFNSWGRDRFWRSDRQAMDAAVESEPTLILLDAENTNTLRNNRFRCDRGWDIDLDDGSSNYHIYNNLCLNGGLKLREGFYRTVENNILINNTFHPHVWFKNSGDVFARNIVMSAYQPIGVSHWGAEVDNNIFVDSIALATAQQNGTDTNSIVGNIRFRAPREGDFRVVESQLDVLRCGFKNFEMNNFGVVSPELRKIAKQPLFPEPIIEGTGTSANIVTWNKLRIKNLETLGERSATGMDSERGIYVVSAGALDCHLRDYIRPNDVILSVGNTITNNVESLLEACRNISSDALVEIVIFRNQKENIIDIPSNLLRVD